MNDKKRYNIRNILLAILWIAIGSASVVLLVAAVQRKDLKHCNGVNISISGVSTNFFIDKGDVEKIIASFTGGNAEGMPVEAFNLAGMEKALKKDVWIQEAELFFDNNEVLQVTVEEREPVARVFTPGGNTFYIDSSNMMLPLSEKFSARVPVFTGFPSEVKVLSKADSNLLNDIKQVSMLIQADTFLMAMIDQVDITPQRSFEMIPKLGDQVIVFGNAADAEAKFRKLLLFYKKVMLKMGWNRYSVINLQYKNQVVAKLRGKDDVSADSLRTKQMMEIIAANAAKFAEDSTLHFLQDDRKNTDSSMIQQSLQRDEPGDGQEAEDKPATQVLTPATPTVKPVTKSPVQKPATEKPKVTMPKKN